MDWTIFAYGPTGWGDELVTGFGITLALAVLSFCCGTVLGFAAGLIELYGPRPVAAFFGGGAMVLRSVPELLMVFLTYYAAGFLLQSLLGWVGIEVSISLGPFAAGVLALSLVQGAYTSEVVKGAIRAVPSGLREAAQALGMHRRTAFVKVVLPLSLRFAFPGLANLWMVVIKNTPFVSAIGLADLIGQASTAGQNTKHYFAFFLAVLLTYLVISAISMVAQIAFEKRLFRHIPAFGA